jgi:hypothetical protein
MSWRQPSASVVGPHAEVLVHLLVPHAGHVLNCQVVLHHLTTNFPAEEDVHVVGEFVRLHADQVVRADPVRGLVRLLRGDIEAVEVVDLGEKGLPEGPRAADVVLPEARL